MEHSSWEPSLPTRGPVRLKRQAVSSQHAVVGQAWGDSYRHPSVRRGGVGDKTESLVHAAWKSSSANPINFRGTVLPSVILGSDLRARCWEKASQKCLSNDVIPQAGGGALLRLPLQMSQVFACATPQSCSGQGDNHWGCSLWQPAPGTGRSVARRT